MQRHFAQQAWYRPDVFERAWGAMQVQMPHAMKTDELCRPELGPGPMAGMGVELAAQSAGYPLPVFMDPRFLIPIEFRFFRLLGFATQVAKAHIEDKQALTEQAQQKCVGAPAGAKATAF
jgi:hypothetical protein